MIIPPHESTRHDLYWKRTLMIVCNSPSPVAIKFQHNRCAARNSALVTIASYECEGWTSQFARHSDGAEVLVIREQFFFASEFVHFDTRSAIFWFFSVYGVEPQILQLKYTARLSISNIRLIFSVSPQEFGLILHSISSLANLYRRIVAMSLSISYWKPHVLDFGNLFCGRWGNTELFIATEWFVGWWFPVSPHFLLYYNSCLLCYCDLIVMLSILPRKHYDSIAHSRWATGNFITLFKRLLAFSIKGRD